MAEDRVLNLDSLTEQITVVFEGQRYVLRSPDQLSWLDYQLFQKEMTRIGELLSKLGRHMADDTADKLSDDEARELTHLLDGVCRRILEAPDEVHTRLGDLRRFELLEAFTKLFPSSRLAARAKEAELAGTLTVGKSPTGESSSPGS